MSNLKLEFELVLIFSTQWSNFNLNCVNDSIGENYRLNCLNEKKYQLNCCGGNKVRPNEGTSSSKYEFGLF